MAFRVQDPVSSLFWEVDSGYRIRLGEKGSVYTHNSDGSIVNVETGMTLRLVGNKVVEGDWAAFWTIADGVISMDIEHIIQYDETSSTLRVASTPAAPWIIIPEGSVPEPEVAVPEPEVAVPEPEVAEPEPEVAEPEPEDEEDEPEEDDDDVPVARSSALIEEALNAQAADAAAAAADEEEA